jgi:hypothetical protein
LLIKGIAVMIRCERSLSAQVSEQRATQPHIQERGMPYLSPKRLLVGRADHYGRALVWNTNPLNEKIYLIKW